ncbi:MAG: hypothetical protein AAGJ46_18635 [Planctomycetota bacterium]
MPDANPFDDTPAPGGQDPPKRKRRAWWRWNLTTLALVLFALVWARQLFGLGNGLTRLLVGGVFVAWMTFPQLIKEVTEPAVLPVDTESPF